MSIEQFDLDEVTRIGNPWHGLLSGTTLTTTAGGISMTVEGGAATVPDTHLVEFPGLPVPSNSTTELAAGRELRNYAVLFDITRRYSPRSSSGLGARRHIYLTDDHTQYYIEIVAGSVSSSIAPGAAWNLPFRLDARKASGGAIGSPEAIVPTENLSIVGIGEGSGRYAQLANFSPNGKRLVICIHKFPSSAAALSLDTRKSLGVAGVWEVVLSGGSKDVAPTAVLSLIKGSAACNLVTNDTPVDWVVDFSYAEVGYGEGTATPLPAPPNPPGLVSLSVWRDYAITLDKVSYSPHSVDYRVLGAAYDVSNTLCLLAFETDEVRTLTDEYDGPDDGATIRLNADIIANAADHSVVTSVTTQDSTHVRVYASGRTTVKHRIKSGATVVYEVTKVLDWTGVDGHGSGKDSSFQMYNPPYPPITLWQNLGGEPVYTFNGATVAGFPAVAAKMTSNNTVAIFCDFEAFAICAPSSVVGGRQTLALDADDLPWCAWHPKSNSLSVVPGNTWC